MKHCGWCCRRRSVPLHGRWEWAIVSDDRPEANVPVWPRADLGSLADRLLALARGIDSY